MNKKLLCCEAAGVLFVAAGSFFMRRLYELCGGELLGILFGSVNHSIWESCKTLLLPYLLWAMLELLSLRLSLHRFAVAKAFAVCLLGGVYILLRLVQMNPMTAFWVSVTAAFLLSFLLYSSPYDFGWLFAPAVCLLFFIAALYVSLTPFPPHRAIFLDQPTGMYGIIPKHIDYGALALDALFHTNIQ